MVIQEVVQQQSEKVGSVSVTGADTRGILISARGKSSGKIHQVLWSCYGQITVMAADGN